MFQFTARLVAIAALTALTCIGDALADERPLSPTYIKEDLVFLRESWAPQDKSFSASQRRQFELFVDDKIAKADTLTGRDLALAVMRAVAIARNGHTDVRAFSLLGDDLPLRLWWFEDGLYIIKARPDLHRLLGARVDRIGSTSAQEAQARIQPLLSGTDQRIRFLAPGFLVTPSILRSIGSIDEVNKSHSH